MTRHSRAARQIKNVTSRGESRTPHFGLMDSEALGPERAALQRARLHLRGGRRRLRQGKTSAGVVAIYDALTSVMEWFCSFPDRRSRLRCAPEVLLNDRSLYAALVSAGILNGSFDFELFNRVVDRALVSEIPSDDASGILEGVESVFTQLGALPFDDEELPPEDPDTF